MLATRRIYLHHHKGRYTYESKPLVSLTHPSPLRLLRGCNQIERRKYHPHLPLPCPAPARPGEPARRLGNTGRCGFCVRCATDFTSSYLAGIFWVHDVSSGLARVLGNTGRCGFCVRCATAFTSSYLAGIFWVHDVSSGPVRFCCFCFSSSHRRPTQSTAVEQARNVLYLIEHCSEQYWWVFLRVAQYL